jgi:glutamate-1-semialdehyde 2,1-aminomutase
VRFVCERYPIAGLIVEPILQNIGIVKPAPGYLSGLRALADEFGFILIFDEVKTGFRHAIGGYSSIANVKPDVVVYGKALANGYPIAVVGGRQDLMDRFVDPVASRRVLLAGTYNAHPVPTIAAIATIERLLMNDGEIHHYVESLGEMMQQGIERIIAKLGVTAVVARQGSAFCLYFMDHLPCDWHDVITNHDFEFDTQFRLALVERGIYVFPLATKQCSLSAAHSRADVELTLAHLEDALGVALNASEGSVSLSSVQK